MKTGWRKSSVSSVLLYVTHVILRSGRNTSQEKKASQQSSVVNPITPETSGKLSKKQRRMFSSSRSVTFLQVISYKILQLLKK